jgi:hypothetical protein
MIKRLEDQGQEIAFPKPVPGFDRFRSDLYAVINENCGYPIAKTLEYDEYEETFYVTVKRSGMAVAFDEDNLGPMDDFNMELVKLMPIDPREPIGPQIDAIERLQHHLNMAHNLLAVLLEKQRQGYKMCDLSGS